LTDQKILIVTHSKELGGAEKSAIKLAVSLAKLPSVQIEFSTLKQSKLDFYKSPPLPELEFLRFFNKVRNSKFFGKTLLLPFCVLVDVFQTRELIKSRNFDVVISMSAGVGCVMYLMLVLSGIPQIVSERTTLDTKVYRPSLLSRLMRPFIYRHGVVCSVQTQGAQEYAQKFWKVESFVTPNHFDIPNSSYLYTKNTLPCIAVGRAAAEKDYPVLFQIWNKVQSQIPNELWIVAHDSEDFIKNMVLEYNCERVQVIEPTHDLLKIYQSSSLFLSTSKVEGFPNAIAEAIVFGLPVLTTKSSSIVTAWSDRGLCLTFGSNSIGAMASRLIEVLRDEDLLREISMNAQSNRFEFTWDFVQEFWINAIKHAIAKN
jgi:glycosyltransferase involved in cell wall biosynthesis